MSYYHRVTRDGKDLNEADYTRLHVMGFLAMGLRELPWTHRKKKHLMVEIGTEK